MTEPRSFALQDGSFTEHPWMRGLVMSPHLTEQDLIRFWKTPHTIHHFNKNESVINPHEDPLMIYVVTSGWLYSYSNVPGGARQIHRIYRDGDAIGDDDFSRERNSFKVVSAVPSRLVKIDMPACRNLLNSHSALLRHLSEGLAHTLLLNLDHTKAVARLSPKARMAHFILAMLNRVRWTSPVADLDLLSLPLSQSVIGDYLGMTSVHVSRMMRALTDEGLIARPSPKLIRILNEPSLIAMADFQDRNAAYQRQISRKR